MGKRTPVENQGWGGFFWFLVLAVIVGAVVYSKRHSG